MSQFSLVSNGDSATLTAFVDGEVLVATQDHPKWEELIASATAGTLTKEQFSVEESVRNFFNLSERVSVSDGRVYFDGDEVNSTLTDHILRLVERGVQPFAFINFYENIAQNPSEFAREQLYNWLCAENFSITNDGLIIGYKSFNSKEDGSFASISSGRATVNGVEQVGNIVQFEGDVVEMPRGAVNADPEVGCSTGLHVGTWEYARSFAGNIVTSVIVNPRDVVSVPVECDAQKMRVCRYVVGEVMEEKFDKPVVEINDYIDAEVFIPEDGRISWAAFDEEYDQLYISFANTDAVYQYRCDEDTFLEFSESDESDSLLQYFTSNIRDNMTLAFYPGDGWIFTPDEFLSRLYVQKSN